MILLSVASLLATVLQGPAAPVSQGAMPQVAVPTDTTIGPGSAAENQRGPSDNYRIARSSSLGAQLHMFDRAAWVSSDALTAAVPRDRLTGIGGYVVERPDPDILRVTYYRGKVPAAEGFFVADVRAGKVVNTQLLAAPVALTSAQSQLAHARELAAETARSRAYTPCSRQPFNTVVLPPRKDGSIAVYLLTP